MPHLQIKKGDVYSKVILPGDPARIKHIIKFLKNVKKVSENRGYIIYNGTFEGVKVTVCNSNMGGPSLAIAVQELIMCGAKTIIRVGSCGSLQTDMKLGELVIPSQAVREEGTSSVYVNKNFPAISDKKVYNELIKNCKSMGVKYYTGTSRSHDSFYEKNNQLIEDFWSRVGLLASDFETAPLFVLGKLFKVRTGSILNIVDTYKKSKDIVEGFEKDLKLGAKMIKKGEENSILVALKAIIKI